MTVYHKIILMFLLLLFTACVPGKLAAGEPTRTINDSAVVAGAAIAGKASTAVAATVFNTPTAANTPTAPLTATSTAAPTETPSAPAETPPSQPAGPAPTPGLDDWKRAPVIPSGVSERARLIYQMGMLKGNNPHAYSKVGDCNTTLPSFMGDFDTAGAFNLGDYAALQETIDYFAGSHSRKSLASKNGLTAHAVLSMLWVDWKECETYETPLTCEYRTQQPAIAIISFGTNDANGNVDFEKALRRVLDMTIGNGTLPILVTKADNAEGDESINRAIVQLANEYELPLWNYWAAVQPLEHHGVNPEHIEHLSEGPHGWAHFDADSLNYGWPVRNLTALQTLDVVRRSLEQVE
jgi:hypothetical protein